MRSATKAAAWAVGLAVLGAPARADYDRTRWGMRVEQVERLYPGGVEAPTSDGRAYAVAREVAGFPSVTSFVFDRDARLRSVFVWFAYAVDGLQPRRMTRSQSDQLRSTIRGLLVERYGTPTPPDSPDLPSGVEEIESWSTRKDWIGLGSACGPAGCNPVLAYGDLVAAKKQMQSGL